MYSIKLDKRLKELRTEKGFTQEEMANILNLAYRSYQNYEAGVSMPNTKILFNMAIYFNVSIDYLVGRSNIRELKIN